MSLFHRNERELVGIDVTKNPFTPHTPEVAPADVHVEAASVTNMQGNEFNVYDYATIRDVADYEENNLYDDYIESYKTNPFTHMLVEYAVGSIIGDGYHFEGGQAQEVEDFFAQDNTRAKLEMACRDGVKLGNGMMDVGGRQGKIVATRALNPYDIQIEIVDDQADSKYGTRTYTQGSKQLKQEAIFHLMFKESPGKAYGMSMLRPNIVILNALMDAGGDMFAAVKRLAYSPIIVGADMDGYRTAADKEKAMKELRDYVKNINSALNNMVIDKRHSVSLLGLNSGAGRLLPTNEMFEPWIAMCLRNFGMPIGTFLQQGANKAIVDMQREDARQTIALLRNRFKQEVETKLIPMILGQKVGTGEKLPDAKLVWNKPNPCSQEVQTLMSTYALLYEKGLISREYFLDFFDLDDTGKTMSPALTQPAAESQNNTRTDKQSINRRTGGKE